MIGRVLALTAAALLAGRAPGQAMPSMDMSGQEHGHHAAPAASAPSRDTGAKPPPAPDALSTRAEAPPVAIGTDLPLSEKPSAAPAPPGDHAADAIYDPGEMASARAVLHHEHGGMNLHRFLFNLAEAQVRGGRDGYRWDAEGWWGGDINRLTIKSEGEGRFGRAVGTAEVQALYSRAIGPYFDMQTGIRQDLAPGPRRSYATIGVEGLAPYWFETEASLFLSNKGDVLARAEAWYDQRLTQRLILQPRVELNFAAQDVAEQRIGHGLTDAELGLRLRYEIRREFAPYAGVAWDRKAGATARLARLAGEDTGGVALVFGIRTWF